MSELNDIPKELEKIYQEIRGMDQMIGQAKTNRLFSFVNKAWRTNKMDQINLVELAQLSVKSLAAATRSL